MELIVQDVISKYNVKNGLPTRNLIPIDILTDAIIYRTQNSHQSRSIFENFGLIDERRKMNVDEPKLLRWLESDTGFTVIEDKVGLNVGDCAHEQ